MDAKGKLTIAFDVDGTLIGQTFSDEDTPKYEVIDLLHWFQRQGHTIIIWSGGGVDYARRWAEKLGLGDVVIAAKSRDSAFVFNVDITVDDEECGLAKINIKVDGSSKTHELL